jgi:voltage-gated potassium channel
VSIAVHGRRVPTPDGSGLYPALVQRFRRREFEREEGLRPAKFGTALLLIVGSIFAIAFSDEGWLRVLALVLEGGALVFILRTSDAHRRFLQVAEITVVVSVLVGSVVAVAGKGESPGVATSLVGAFLAIGAPIAIVRRLVRERVIDLQVLAGALCLYLLLGLFFTFVYSIIKVIDPPLFVQQADASTVDITYFSYITMTTVGYGDLTLRADVPRMFAVTEALMGQLYLVSAVALVVSRLGQERTRLRGTGDTSDET